MCIRLSNTTEVMPTVQLIGLGSMCISVCNHITHTYIYDIVCSVTNGSDSESDGVVELCHHLFSLMELIL